MFPELTVCGGKPRAGLIRALDHLIRQVRPSAVGIASAYVTVPGVEGINRSLTKWGNPSCRLIAGVDGLVTQPGAVKLAIDNGWKVRFGPHVRSGIFHPKLMVLGERFGPSGRLRAAKGVYLGSGNLTPGGLYSNLELGVIGTSDPIVSEAADAFSWMWGSGRPVTDRLLAEYTIRFAEEARSRRPKELDAFGIGGQGLHGPTASAERRGSRPSGSPAYVTGVANCAWTGLESFTGEFTLQVEFPRRAGEVLWRLAGKTRKEGRVPVLCDDGKVREMLYKYYDDNSMFRLNVPEEVPGVEWTRAHHRGVAVLCRVEHRQAVLVLRLLKPGRAATELRERSEGLGTLGQTPTRLYGWY